MDDGKSIRYKDLYALFEHILEKTMRQEQRDWSESPVKVWVNTFKVFLDEFMTEYKPMDSQLSKVKTRNSLLTAQENRRMRSITLLLVLSVVYIMLIFIYNTYICSEISNEY